MLSASSTMYKKIKLLGVLTVIGASVAHGQTENSPYSRYGLGDLLPEQNIMMRGMGGISAAYSDKMSVNFTNPASYARLDLTTLDFGVELNSRTLRIIDPPQKFTSVSPTISYVQLGIPLSKTRNWGMNIGLRPVSRINYKIERNERLPGIDSVSTLFEGNGGTYEVYTGTGFTIGKNLALGFNVGYLFGLKDYSSNRSFIPDSSTSVYLPSMYNNSTNYGGFFGNAGLQYTIPLSKRSMIRLGAYGRIKREFNATREEKVYTYTPRATGGLDTIDMVSRKEIKGKIVYPASYGFGAVYYAGERAMIGVDYSQTGWSQYRYFTAIDSVQDSWKVNVGAQIVPNVTGAVKSYWGRVTYRAGFSFGKDYIKLGEDLSIWTASVGLGLPMRKSMYTNQYSIINTSLEFGRRGNKNNFVNENFFRLSLGLTLSDIWFIKRKYD